MSVYTILKTENISDVLKSKSRVTNCITFTAFMLAVTACAVGIGVFFGYTYCYIEHHTGIKQANITRAVSYHPMDYDSDEEKGNRTINGALASSVLVSKILHLGSSIMENEGTFLPWRTNQYQMFRYA